MSKAPKWGDRNQFIPPDLREAARAEQPVVKGEGYVRLAIHPGFQNRGWLQAAARLRATVTNDALATDEASRGYSVTMTVRDNLGQQPQVTIQVNDDSVEILLATLADCYVQQGHSPEQLQQLIQGAIKK